METFVKNLTKKSPLRRVLEVTMRDGNAGPSSRNSLLPTLSFRSDYEGWKLKPYLKLLPYYHSSVLEVTMRDGNKPRKSFGSSNATITVLEVTMRDGNIRPFWRKSNRYESAF